MTITDKTLVTISRYWNNPAITTTVSNKSIGISVSMDDFKEALKHEMGSVALVFTEQALSDKIDKAVIAVLEKIKEESIKVV